MKSLLLLAVVLCISHTACAFRKPNILFIVADDLGYADVSYHDSDLSTPNIDHLASQGIRMENYYVHMVCTPARSSLMTGRYPCRYGLQHGALQAPQPAGLNLTEVTLAEKLREAGYATHALGKWHLGYYDIKYTPTYRGFDSFFGFWNGEQDYINHTETWGGYTGYDYRNNTEVYNLTRGEWAASLLEAETLRLLNNHAATPHNRRKPFLIYLALQTPHSPLEPRPQDVARCNSSITDLARKLYCGLVVNLDDIVGNVTGALKTLGLADDTVIVFTNDNGGWNLVGGYNYPYRGGKFTNWEGGLKGVSVVAGAGVPFWKKGTIYKGLMHAVDWFPTMLHVAGGNTHGTKPLDAVDQWDSITLTGVSPRIEVLHSMDEVANNSAIRFGDWKLISGQQVFDGYFRPLPAGNTPPPPENPLSLYTYLFNIAQDPYETTNLAAAHPEIVHFLQERINYYKAGSVPSVTTYLDPASNPAYFNGVWTPWVHS